jgi:hypothetical protein
MNDRADSRIIHIVARDDKDDGQDVVREHLPVVFSWLFRVDNVELMKPPTELGEVVKFRQCWQEVMWVSCP